MSCFLLRGGLGVSGHSCIVSGFVVVLCFKPFTQCTCHLCAVQVFPPNRAITPPLSFPRGGGWGDHHLLNPKFFVAAHCVVVAKPPPKSAAQSLPVESGEHVQEFKVKWSRTKKIYTELVKE